MYYAAFILHDKDKNKKMKTNALGMPTEGCGASNGAQGGISGGPSWNDAKFYVGECDRISMDIEMWYS